MDPCGDGYAIHVGGSGVVPAKKLTVSTTEAQNMTLVEQYIALRIQNKRRVYNGSENGVLPTVAASLIMCQYTSHTSCCWTRVSVSDGVLPETTSQDAQQRSTSFHQQPITSAGSSRHIRITCAWSDSSSIGQAMISRGVCDFQGGNRRFSQ